MAKYTYEVKPAKRVRKGKLDADNIQKARAKAIRIVKAYERIYIYKDGEYQGYIYLTYKGTAIFVRGHTAWYCSPQGTISKPEYYGALI